MNNHIIMNECRINSNYLTFDCMKSLNTYNLVNIKTHKSFVDYLFTIKRDYWYFNPINNYKKLFVAVLPYYKDEEHVKNDRGFNRFVIENHYKIEIDYSYIISFMLVIRTKDIYYIDFIETNQILSCCGIGSQLIREYIKKYNVFDKNKIIIPIMISESAVIFWSRFFEEHYNIYNMFGLKKFEETLPKHKKHKINWKFLYEYYNEDLINFTEKHSKSFHKKYVER